TGGTADRNRSHWSTSKTPSYTKSVSWQHHRQLNENSFAITTSLAASEIEDLIRLKCLDLPDIDFDLNIMTVDDYFRQFYK
ncbi:type V toxin-antitoxin system endoribonuclease antitoxin GhoS, partial [Shigella sonnei]|uniref:type V toxin-antitoxin system endoribonuclease antitoxin GhoS n=1 Tax=Shigella sonnei TaxID=624 RepID=UPI002094C8C0